MSVSPSSTHAYGKVILLGEHAVVYGYPALCGALSQGVTITLLPGNGHIVFPALQKRTVSADILFDALLSSIDSTHSAPKVSHPFITPPATPNSSSSMDYVGGSLTEWPFDHPFHQAYQALLAAPEIFHVLKQKKQHGQNLFDWDFEVEFQVPLGAGLGSSAAFSVALARALVTSLEFKLINESIFALAQRAEEIFHGQSSGLDATLSTWGGIGVFQKGVPFQKLCIPAFSVCIVNTGTPKETKAQVQKIAEQLETYPVETKTRLYTIGNLVLQGTIALQQKDFSTLGQMMNQNHKELQLLGVSTPLIDQLCDLAVSQGALGAKLTGGGGGGCLIILAPEQEQQIQAIFQKAGFSAFVTTLGLENHTK